MKTTTNELHVLNAVANGVELWGMYWKNGGCDFFLGEPGKPGCKNVTIEVAVLRLMNYIDREHSVTDAGREALAAARVCREERAR